MGDIMSALQTAGSGIMQGVEGIPGDIAGLGQGLSSLFSGGGGPLSPGTIGADASTMAAGAPNVGQFTADAAANAVAPAASSAASFAGLPGVGADMSSVIPSASTISGAYGGAGVDPSMFGLTQPQFVSDAAAGIGVGAGDIAPTTSNLSTGLTSANPTADIANPNAINPSQVTLTPGVAANPAGMGSNFLQRFMSNPNAIKLLGEGGLLGAELLNAGKAPPGEAALKQLATQQAGFAKNQGELALGETAGMLPQGLTNMYQQMLDANLAAVRAQHAGNPGSSAQMQDEMKVRQDIQNQMAVAGQQLAQSGWQNVNQATGYQSQLLQTILDAETQQSTQLGQALAAFAGAAAK